MKETDAPAPFKRWLGIFGSVQGIVTAILAIVTALLGVAGTYPAIVSALTAIVLSIALWALRWPGISEQNPSPILLPEPVKVTTPKSSFPFFDVLLNRPFYKMHVSRRRIETGALFSVSCVALLFSGAQYWDIQAELSGMYCPRNQQGSLRVIIANLNRPQAQENPTFEQSVLAEMQRQYRGSALVCRYKFPIPDIENALSLGKQYSAAIIVWGNTDNNFFQVYVEDTELDRFGNSLTNFPDENGIRFMLRGAEEIPFLVGYVHSIILYVNGDTPGALDGLEKTLENADKGDWGKLDPQMLAEGHYFIGQLYQVSAPPDYTRALRHYDVALKLFPGQMSIYFSRGFAYFHSGQPDLAIADFTRIIESDPSGVPYAYTYRAKVYFQQGLYNAAVSDYEIAKDLTDDLYGDPYAIYDLSVAQAFSGDQSAAVKTLEGGLIYIQDSYTRDDFILGFELLQGQFPEKYAELEELKQILVPMQFP